MLTVVVAPATAAAVTKQSYMSLAGSAGGARWSISETPSNPLASAARTRSRIVANGMRIWGMNNENNGCDTDAPFGWRLGSGLADNVKGIPSQRGDPFLVLLW